MEYNALSGWLNNVTARVKIDSIPTHIEYAIVFGKGPSGYTLYRSKNLSNWENLGEYERRSAAMHDMKLAINEDLDVV